MFRRTDRHPHDEGLSFVRIVWAPVLVLVLGVAATGAVGAMLRDADHEALRADVEADAAQVGLLIQSLANGLETDLTSTVGVALATDGDEAIYRARAGDGSGGVRALVSLRPAPEVLVAIDGEGGDEPAVAASVLAMVTDPTVLPDLQRLADKSEFGFVQFGDSNGARSLLIAAGASDEDHAYVELRRIELGPTGPLITDLIEGIDHFAVYISEEPDPATAVFASTDELPLEGETATVSTNLGGQELLVQARGTVQAVVPPWAVLASGTTLSVLFAALLLLAQRRRSEAVTALAEARVATEARHRLEGDLQQAQRMEAVGQLAGGIAHDFNNLLAAITSTVELLDDDVTDPRMREDLDEIRHAARRGAALTRRLLSFSRRDVEAREVLDLQTVVEDVAPLLRRSVSEDISLQFDLSPTPITVLGDAGELEQVLLNLVVNARDATAGPDHTIEVSTAVVDGRARLTVTDNGTGMRPEIVERAFEPFFSTKPKTDGTGLGLAIVYGIANRMGGDVSIESTAGTGTSVSVWMPVLDATGTAVTPVTSEPFDPGELGRSELILLVEDEATVRRATRRLLERAGHRVVDVGDGIGALSVVEDGLDPTVVVTDVVLPGSLTGRDVANQVLQLVPTARIVFASGYPAEIISRRQLLDDGAVFVAKPFSVETLLAAVSGTDPVEVGA